VAVSSVIAGITHPGDRAAQAELIRQVLESQASGRRIAQQTMNEGERLSKTLSRVNREFPQMRRFVRQVDRIRSEQRNRLLSAIHEPEALKSANARLDQVILTHVTRFLQLD
jgi:hypothetical protein